MKTIIGIIADSHDHVQNLKQAVDLFNKESVSRVLHAGDLVSPFTIRVLKHLECPIDLVFGNNDGDKPTLIEFFKGKGVFHGSFADLTIANRRIGMLHGINQSEYETLASAGLFDVLIIGHSHQQEIKHYPKTLLINPGEACGYLSGESTIALLNLDTLEAEIKYLQKPQPPLLP